MAQLNILEFPDPRLRQKALPVARVTSGITELIDDMLETMYAAPGIGLAATQVDVHKRIVVVDVSESLITPMHWATQRSRCLVGYNGERKDAFRFPAFLRRLSVLNAFAFQRSTNLASPRF
ncbi:MAG: hypothetical protein Ct9H300mP8_08350 [Gammaproteobacteria bacterium]|nr:MAG: hypothetical protein Ct9H300mP8_08350 [Gammaproteobacteria bacterium]